jgi:uncharacterized protein (TIGR02246 family)
MQRYVFLALLSLALSVAPAAWAGPEDEIRPLFGRFVAAQNAHDLSAVGDLLWDSARFLWVTRGTAIWGREAGLKRFEALYHGTWRLEVNAAELHVTMLSNDVAQLYVPIVFTIGSAGQAAHTTRFLMNQTIIKTPAGWKVASILPIPVPVRAAGIPSSAGPGARASVGQ